MSNITQSSSAVSSRRVMAPPAPYDLPFIITVITIMLFGLLMVTSASIEVSDHHLHEPFHYFYRQLIYIILGIGLGCAAVLIEIALWEKISGTLLISAIVLLIVVLLPGIGHAANGSMRWIAVGPIGVQASEIAKFAMVMYMASYLLRFNNQIKVDWHACIKPMAILGLMTVLLIREPDFGATAVIVTTALGMMFLAGMQLRLFFGLLILMVVGLSILAISEPYRLERIVTFLNPWANPFDSGYQLTQSLIAFGRGGWFGVGLGKSIQKVFYLPEAHTDFLFAVVAEELGFIGMLAVIGLFTFLVMRIFWIGRQAQQLEQHFAAFLAYGFALWIAIQFTVSIGVNTGMLPTKGLTLPLMSYGGSSMLVNCIVIAVLLRIDYENRMVALGLR